MDTNSVGGCKEHDGYFGPSYNLLQFTSRGLHKLTALDVQTVSQIITAQLTSCACDHYSEDLSLSVGKMSFVMRWLQNPASYIKATKTAFCIGRDLSWAVKYGLSNAKPSFIARAFYVQFIVNMATPGQVFSEHCRIKNQLDATCYFIVLIGSTCFEHYYAHHQELATLLLITTLVVSFLVYCMLEVRCS